MGQTRTYTGNDRDQVVGLLEALLDGDTAAQLRTASTLAWIGIRTRKRDASVRGRLSSAARGRVSEVHLLPVLKALPTLPLPVRCELAMALGDLAGGVAASELARLAVATSAEARLISVDALGKIGGPRAVEMLMAAAGDVNETVRAEVARALGQLALAEMEVDASEAVAVESLLLDVSAGDPSEYVREVADEALAALREASSLPSHASADRTPVPVTSVTA